MDSLLGKNLEEIGRAIAATGEPGYRAAQIYEWMYARRTPDFALMTNLPAALRETLEKRHPMAAPVLEKVETSADGTMKHLFGVPGGRIESVLIPEPARTTFCISSQVGCALDCAFCLTAKLGFGRHLSAGEIVSQVLAMLRGPEARGRPVNIVFMGMGEPLHNYDEALRAFRLLSDPKGVGIPARRITLSTAGLVPGIRRLAAEKPRPRLAISLNASEDATRSRIMPINRKHPIAELLGAASELPLGPRERVTFEYVMLDGINASPGDARRLGTLFGRHRVKAKLNLIPFNPGDGLPFRSPPREAIRAFRDIILSAGYPCSIRKNRGRDISAACGQLALVAGGAAREQ